MRLGICQLWHGVLSFCYSNLPYVELGVPPDSCVLYSFSPQDHAMLGCPWPLRQ